MFKILQAALKIAGTTALASVVSELIDRKFGDTTPDVDIAIDIVKTVLVTTAVAQKHGLPAVKTMYDQGVVPKWAVVYAAAYLWSSSVAAMSLDLAEQLEGAAANTLGAATIPISGLSTDQTQMLRLFSWLYSHIRANNIKYLSS